MIKKRVALVFGGRSAEHEVSLMSAKNVAAAIDRARFDLELVYQNESGEFACVKNVGDTEGETVEISFWKGIDVAFPVMHGPHCEDGAMQGFFETLGVKYVGSKVLGSALCMDKDVQKQLARSHGILVTDWITIRAHEYESLKGSIAQKVESELGLPAFVKPANLGSSIGITRAKDANELLAAIDAAFTYDTKVIIEKAVRGRELEVAVLGCSSSVGNLQASPPGEVVPTGSHEFYDYDAKYFDSEGSKTCIPAQDISAEKIEEIQELSKKIFTVLECSGLARIDYFLDEQGHFILNEINTLPGFTNISMYPKLIAELGISYSDLITALLDGSN